MSRPKLDYVTASKANYKEFCKNYPNIFISFDVYKNIIYTTNDLYAKYVLDGEKVKLPQGFGSLAINKKKQRIKINIKGVDKMCLAIDWPETKKHGKYIYHMNSHTDGYRFKWYWFKAEAFLPDHFAWSFNATRINSRKLAQLLKDENSSYINLYKEHHVNET